VDDFNRGCLAAEVDTSITGTRVVRVLERLREQRGLPQVLVTDDALTYKSRILGIWDSAQGSPCWSWASEIDGLGQAAPTVRRMKL
jgi:putative transposase